MKEAPSNGGLSCEYLLQGIRTRKGGSVQRTLPGRSAAGAQAVERCRRQRGESLLAHHLYDKAPSNGGLSFTAIVDMGEAASVNICFESTRTQTLQADVDGGGLPHVNNRNSLCYTKSSAIWTAFVAAPLRIWSPQQKSVIAFTSSGADVSRRMRPTKIRS